MKYLSLLLLPFLLLGVFAFQQPSTAPAASPPVVLELFTSQGCSSCPPADALLASYADREDVIALSFHVDYWDYLGWKDPFSSPHFSARQTDYTEQFGARTYTPQLVVNGRKELIGSRKTEVKQAVAEALRAEARFTPELTTKTENGTVTVSYKLAGATTGHRVTALLVQPQADSAVKRGENRGRDLHHVNVVRAMEHAPAAATGELTLTIPKAGNQWEVVLLVQNEETQAIVGAGKA
ncbi:MAG: DUF1223 domain-containing protein [Bacteroidota bacterium]